MASLYVRSSSPILNCLGDFGKNEGLILRSEQVGENIHHECFEKWKNYKMNFIVDPRHRKRLKAAVTEFSPINV